MVHNTTTASTQYTYKAHERDTLLSEVSSVQLVLLPRALAIAGFTEDGQVLMVHYTAASTEHIDWGCDFFEHQFINEPLLGVPQQVKSLFVGSPYQLIIPDALYDERSTRSWLKNLYSILPDDWITEYHSEWDQAWYRMAIPRELHKLLTRYFGHTAVLPLAAPQFYKPDTSKAHLVQCIISGDLVFATLREQGKLQWHKVFEYSNVEDIAWQFAHICKQRGIRQIELRIEGTILCETCYDQLTELETFFPKIKWSAHSHSDEGHWAPVIWAMQQLYACAL